MIIDRVTGDILETEHQHIAFAVNAEGINDSGFAGVVARTVWPEIAFIGESKLGTSYGLVANGKNYHALVCHSLGHDGWLATPTLLRCCLDELDVPEDETIAIVAIGAGPVGQMQGADTSAIGGAMMATEKKLVVYSL